MTLRWFLAGTVAAVIAGWLAARCHLSGWAPVGLLPLGIGIGLGYCVSRLATHFGIRCRKRLLAGSLLFVIVTVFVEHAWLYRDFRRQWHQARADSPQAAMFRPEQPWSPAEYLRQETTPARIALWYLDATLIAAGTVGTLLFRNRSENRKRVAPDTANPQSTLTSDL